jgi:hypothetical protein
VLVDAPDHSTRRNVLRAASRVNSSTASPTSATTLFIAASTRSSACRARNSVHPKRARARPFFAPTGRNMPALKGNAAKHFRSRIRENSDDFRAFRILTNSATIRSQAFSASGNASRRSLKGRNRTRWAFVPPFQGSVFVDSQPGASLAAHAASLCPRLICSAPSGQCPSLHVNRRAFRKIRPRTLRRMKPNLPRSARVSDPAETADRRSPANPPCSARWLGQRPATALRVNISCELPKLAQQFPVILGGRRFPRKISKLLVENHCRPASESG